MGKRLGQETRDEIRDFFASSAGSVVLDSIIGVRDSNNNLISVLNQASTGAHPELVVARAGGVVEGIDRVLGLIESLKVNEEE